MRPRRFTDEELLAVARRCFLEHGPGVSTAIIADALGVSQPALFHRIKTKEALLLGALSPKCPDWIRLIERAPDQRSVYDQLLALAREIDAFADKMMPAIATLRASGLSPAQIFAQFDEPPPARAVRGLTRWFESLRGQGRIDVANSEATAIAFLAALHGRDIAHQLLGELHPDGGPGYPEQVVEIFVRGLGCEDGRGAPA